MTLCLSERPDIRNNRCAFSDLGVARPDGLGRLQCSACSIPSEIRSVQCLLELVATPLSGLVYDSGSTVCVSSSLSQPDCLLNWRS